MKRIIILYIDITKIFTVYLELGRPGLSKHNSAFKNDI